VLARVLSGLPAPARATLRLTCAAVAAAVADTFDSLLVDVEAFSSGGPAAAASLARAAPLARRAVLRLPPSGGAPHADELASLLALLAASKPRLDTLVFEEARCCWGGPVPAAGAGARHGGAFGAALAAAAAASGLGARLRRLEAPPSALAAAAAAAAEREQAQQPEAEEEQQPATGHAAPPPPLPRLRALSGLREAVLREADPEEGPGLAPGALQELAAAPGLAALAADLDTRAAARAWSAVLALPSAPAGAALTELRLTACGPGGVELPAAAWLARLPRLRRLDLGRGLALDFSDWEAGSCGGGGAAAATTTPALPAPLRHVALAQPRLAAAGWRALAALPRLEALELWRCGPPPPGALTAAARALAAPAADAAAAGAPAPGAGRARPFPALARLHLGTLGDPCDLLSALTPLPLPALRALSLHHAGGRGFGADAPCRLAGLGGLTRLVLMPVSSHHVRWSQARVPVTPEEAALLAALPGLAVYDGPIPGADAARWGGWAGQEQRP
jgi:hypothetical protein